MAESTPDPLNPNKKLYTYENSERPFEMPAKAGIHLEAITNHIEQHIGKVGSVFHEIVSDQVHVDVILVPPNQKFADWTLVTSGMSDRPMRSSSGKEAYAELLIRLPRNWKIGGTDAKDDAWKKEENYWPIRLLKFIARFPHKYGAFLWVGHTLDNGQPATPWSKAAPYKAAFLGPSRTLPEAFENLELPDGKSIKFMALYPCFLEESALARKQGADALWKKFVDHTITDVAESNRPNLVTGKTEPVQKSFWDRLRGR